MILLDLLCGLAELKYRVKKGEETKNEKHGMKGKYIVHS
jgi:hypothetical protein